jgi:hypothetical protein
MNIAIGSQAMIDEFHNNVNKKLNTGSNFPGKGKYLVNLHKFSRGGSSLYNASIVHCAVTGELLKCRGSKNFLLNLNIPV